MKKLSYLLGTTAVLAAALTLTATTQGGARSGSLAGEVMDPSGAVVPGARVVVSTPGWSEEVKANDRGQFIVSGLRAGTYELSVSSNGFAPYDAAGLRVSHGEGTKVDAHLEVAPLHQEITVIGQSR